MWSAAMTDASSHHPGRDRRWWTAVLVALTIIALLASTVAVWVRATVLDTDRFMAIVEPTLTDEAFPGALSGVVAEQVLIALDLDGRVATSLSELDAFLVESVIEALGADPAARARLARLDRPTLAALAPAIAAGLEARVVEVVETFVHSEAVTERLPDLVRQAHGGGVALLRDDLTELPNVAVTGESVRLDLVPVIAEALQRVVSELRTFLPDVTIPEVVDGQLAAGREQLAEALRTRLPPDFGQLTIMSASDLRGLQAAARTADRLVWATVVLTVALLALTIGTSRERRRTLLQLTAGLAVAVLAATLLVRRLEAAVLAEITHPDGLRAAGVLLGGVTNSLRSVALLVAFAAASASAAAYVAGGPPWLAGLRERWRAPSGTTPGSHRAPELAATGATHDERKRP
jgi:hypothetical protein